MTNTGYLLSNGNDISTLFKQATGGATQTGLLMNNGADIGTIQTLLQLDIIINPA